MCYVSKLDRVADECVKHETDWVSDECKKE